MIGEILITSIMVILALACVFFILMLGITSLLSALKEKKHIRYFFVNYLLVIKYRNNLCCFGNMKQKIDVEFYTIWIARFMDVRSINGYHIFGEVIAESFIELNKKIREYLDNNLNMFVHSKKKQERIKFEWSKKSWDLVMRSEEY